MTLLEQLTQKLEQVPLSISSTRRAGFNGLRNAEEVAAALMPIVEGAAVAKPAYPLSLSDMVLTYGADRKNWPSTAPITGAEVREAVQWLSVEQFDEEKYDTQWVSFSDGEAVATRLIRFPNFMQMGLAFQPTHFQPVALPNANQHSLVDVTPAKEAIAALKKEQNHG